jgi:hypothetical protein
MKTTNTKEEICDETCDCHGNDVLDDNRVVVGNNVETSATGGAGMSDEMKELLKLKETLK